MGRKYEPRSLLRPARLEQAGQLDRIRILLGDDHRSVSKVVAGLLAPEFEIIASVSNGRSLVDKAMELEPDVIVTDISMPILNGIEAALELKNLGCASTIVFLSVHSSSDFVRACLFVGALGYVVTASNGNRFGSRHPGDSGRTYLCFSWLGGPKLTRISCEYPGY
jgi:CheY-like chemotaxis protein